MSAIDDAASTFHRLHISGCFVMPDPFDAGSARELEQMGCKALATTGIAGLSIEDATGDVANPPHDCDLALERIRAAR